jgi:hypothetical protein
VFTDVVVVVVGMVVVVMVVLVHADTSTMAITIIMDTAHESRFFLFI